MEFSGKKEIAVSFLQLASSGKVREAYEKYIHPDFLHHNPYFMGDRESLLVGMEDSAIEFPDKAYEAVRVLEDGDFVAVHGRIRLKPDTPEYVLIHIFRFEGDRIVEEWEAGQEIPGESPNKNGMF
ncbi:MAG: nuclear transport factor 2 family protein [Candidatus Aminicenantales bacterium]